MPEHQLWKKMKVAEKQRSFFDYKNGSSVVTLASNHLIQMPCKYRSHLLQSLLANAETWIYVRMNFLPALPFSIQLAESPSRGIRLMRGIVKCFQLAGIRSAEDLITHQRRLY
ncbi:hypothetical protein T11_15760 [Trichinella zimbabwensis]|uniref:Uncharacterized protein n=1 Tax=Trichinella zimbabwensis TaxID=268475 RepID=A0A0V1HDK7_9BILA|nr:hypothetical protein T11_15760 [Trichinella zimbabwensis]